MLILVIIIWSLLQHRLKGGELFEPDFDNGFDLYIEERYTQYLVNNIYEIDPHSLWLITNDDYKNSIYSICKTAVNYREFYLIHDVVFGTPYVFTYLPQIYFDTGTYVYRIQIVNWDNYVGSSWDSYSIKNEMADSPLLLIWRFDVSSMPADVFVYDYVRAESGRDSLNSEGGGGWYSTIPREKIDELHDLLAGIGNNVASEAAVIDS
ncbi:MAG: hypothetical protein FWH33_08615 [Oscillospiraceae bacterium]|nr:hypothetical protein [Oscillospiraceae bacterium]